MPSFFTRRKSSTTKPPPVSTLARRPSPAASTSSQDSPLSPSVSHPLSTPPPDETSNKSSGPPAYSPSYVPSTLPASYSFVQNAPFSMTLRPSPDSGNPPLYHIALGLNVWMPGASVTYVRRGGDASGPLVAQLEMGMSISSANITFAEEFRPPGCVMFRKSANSSSRYYFTGDGTIVRWKIGPEEWEASTNSLLIAKFNPSLSSRTFTLLDERACALLDHLVLCLLVLMREYLAPTMDGMGLFNQSTSADRELANQEW